MSPLRFLLTMLAAASVAFVADPSAADVSADGSFVASGSPNVMTPPNGTPIGVDDEYETVQDTRLIVDAPGVLANDSDPDGDPISFGFNSIPANGTIFGFLDDGAFTCEPDPGFVGVDTFLYSVQDDQGNFTGATVAVTITVTAAPDPTTTTDPAATTTEGETADSSSEADPAPPTDPTTPTESDGTDAAPEVDQTGSVLAGTDETTGVLSAATSDPAITTTTLPGTLPVTGVEPIALGIGSLLILVGVVVTALGTIAVRRR